MEFKKKGVWEKKRLEDYLSGFEPEFQQLKISKKTLPNFIHDARNKCAHINTDYSDRIIGLNLKDTKTVESFLPFFRKILLQHMNQVYAAHNIQFITG